jgi:hypothetical protein
MRILRLTPFAALALALCAAPAAAQSGNQTDPSGPNITGSGPHGGSYLGGGIRTENEMFARSSEKIVFRNGRVGCAVRDASREYLDSLRTAPLDDVTRSLAALLASPGADRADRLAAGLANGSSDPAVQAHARTIADALAGLFVPPDSAVCSADRERYEEAPRWETAIRALNELVELAPDSYFAPPPCELVAVRNALRAVVERALGRRYFSN